MSGLTGPCPSLLRRVARYEKPSGRCLAVKLGCDVPPQVSERFGVGLDEVVGLDLEHTEGRSVWQELFFAFCSPGTKLSGEGAV